MPKAPEVLSPKREASQRILLLGQGYLDQGDLDRASQTFQEAINVDQENGIAYYYMAKVMYQKKEYDDALGLLEKGETLLQPYPEWVDEVERLRKMILEQHPPDPKHPANLIYH